MDEVIFEEFKGTGNSELILDRKVADKRTFPAMNITRSGTRKEELPVPPDQRKKMYVLRRILNPMAPWMRTVCLLFRAPPHTSDRNSH